MERGGSFWIGDRPKKSGIITFSLPDGEVTLRNIVGNTRIQVTMQDGKPFFEVNTAVSGTD